MTLSLEHDAFFDSFIKLPLKIQKKVIAFRRKFKENPRSASINLESIHVFKDPKLRTARIDDKYRAVVLAPPEGTVYSLLWVDNHDEAVNWGKNKIFEWNKHTHAFQSFIVPESEKKAKNELNEETQVDNYFFHRYSDAQLLKVGVPEVLLPLVRNIVDLNDFEKIDEYLPKDAFENLFAIFDGATIENLIFEIEEGKVKSNDLEDQVKSINNRRNFIEITDDDALNEVLSGELRKWKYYLHPSQSKIVYGNFNGPAKITGGAGTGKTVAALHRLKFLTENKIIDKPVLFTTYTKALTNNLLDLTKSLKIELRKIELNNIDSIAVSLARRYNIITDAHGITDYSQNLKTSDLWNEVLKTELSSFEKDFLVSEYSQVVLYHDVRTFDQYLHTARPGRNRAISRRKKKEIWALIEKYNRIKESQNLIDRDELFNKVTMYLVNNNIHPYSFCIADELQDMSNVELRFLRALVEEKPNDLFLVGDPYQNIYNKKIIFSDVGINIRGLRSKKLRVNYRTSEEIRKLAISVIEDSEFDDFNGADELHDGYISLFHGKPPTYNLYQSSEEEVEHVINELQELISANIKLSEVAICSRKKDGLKSLISSLHLRDIPYYNISDEKERGDPSGVRLSTFHNMKGLEFKHVFLIDVNNDTAPLLTRDYYSGDNDQRDSYLKSEKSLLYVAISRAIQNVVIHGVGKGTKLISVSD